MTKLFIVVPCFNEEEALPSSAAALSGKLNAMISKGLVSSESRIVYVDDGSSDRTWELIESLHRSDPLSRGIRLSRNVGHQNALTAGLVTLCEEADAIIPAIEKACAEGIDADGPVPPDTVFVKAAGGVYDIVVAMYHDQGHIPLKLFGFRMDPKTGLFSSMSGINTTIGLPIIRTSVDHGTAFDRAGKNTANEMSMVEAITTAVQMIPYYEAKKHA